MDDKVYNDFLIEIWQCVVYVIKALYLFHNL